MLRMCCGGMEKETKKEKEPRGGGGLGSSR